MNYSIHVCLLFTFTFSNAARLLITKCFSSDPIETSHNTTDPIDILYESETRWPRTNRSTVNFPRNLRDELPYWRDEAEALDQAVDQGGSHGFLRFLQHVIQRGGSNGCKVKAVVFEDFHCTYSVHAQ